MNSLDDVIVEIMVWQRETFTEATTHSRKTHLSRELVELKKELDKNNIDWSEVADVLFMIIGLADGEDVSLVEVLRDKLEINQKRVWGKPDADGVVEHVRGTLLEVLKDDMWTASDLRMRLTGELPG